MMIKKKIMFYKRKILHKDLNRNFDSNKFHFIKKSIDQLLRDLFRMTNWMTNQMKIECALMKCVFQKSIFLCRCNQISLNHFETKICSIMYKKNENVFEMQKKYENIFLIQKFEIIQLIVFFEMKNLLKLYLKKLFTLFLFSCVFFEIFKLIVFVFSLQNYFDLTNFHFFNFEIESIYNNNSFICSFEICVNFFSSMIFFDWQCFWFFEICQFRCEFKKQLQCVQKSIDRNFFIKWIEYFDCVAN